MRFFRKQKDDVQEINSEYVEQQYEIPEAVAPEPVEVAIGEAALPDSAVLIDPKDWVEPSPAEHLVELQPEAPPLRQTVTHQPFIVDIIAPWDLVDTSQLAAVRADAMAKHVEINTVVDQVPSALPEAVMMMPISGLAAPIA